MLIICRSPQQRLMPLALFAVLVFASVLARPSVQVSRAETPDEAIKRIQAGRYTAMPPATTAAASGPAGKGMTIENGTGQTLHLHFSGPMNRTVVVPNGTSESVELAVGDYQVAAEVPGSKIVPFYGRQAYQPFTHYWLKFYTQRVDPAGQRAAPLTRAPEPATAQGPSDGSSSATDDSPTFLDDLAKLELRVTSVEGVTESRQDLKALTSKIKFPPETGHRLLIVTLTGKTEKPVALVFRREDFAAVHRNGGQASIFSADAIGYGPSFVWLTGPTVLIHVRQAGPVSLRMAVTVLAEVDSFWVRYPTVAQGRAAVPKP